MGEGQLAEEFPFETRSPDPIMTTYRHPVKEMSLLGTREERQDSSRSP
jgi:hypothetical protein